MERPLVLSMKSPMAIAQKDGNSSVLTVSHFSFLYALMTAIGDRPHFPIPLQPYCATYNFDGLPPMPTISMFYGILIAMYVLDGALPARQMKLVQAWIELHRDDLMADWILASSGQPPFKIDPLR